MISEIDFKSPCPVQECINNSRVIRWTHHCGGYKKITDQGRIYCCKCNGGGLLIDQTFNCGAHDSKYPSSQGFIHAISVMAKLDTINQKFLSRLMVKVGEQFSNKN